MSCSGAAENQATKDWEAGDRPRICLIGLENLPVLSPSYSRHRIGGEQVQQTLLARAFVRRGYRVSMVVADYGQKDGETFDGVTTYKAFKVSAGVPVVRFIHPRWTGLWSALERADADVYYTSCAGMQVGLICLFCKVHKKRFVFRVASDSDCEPENLSIKYWRDKYLYEYGLKRAHSVLVQTDRQRKSLSRNYGLHGRQAGMLVSPPVTTLLFEQRELDLLWVSNICQVKRPDVYLELAKLLPSSSMHMVGGPMPGFAELYDKIEGAASLLPNVSFHGQVPYHDSFSYYARAKLFINTSDLEGFPNSYLQSWVHGTPVVAFFDPDGLIAREGLGRAVGSLSEMAKAISDYQDRNTWEQASARARAYMNRVHGEDMILRPYLEEIHRTVSL